MAETLQVAEGNKEEKYQMLLPQLRALVEAESDLYAALANCSAAFFATFECLWVGFYLVKKSELVLGPFQGPVACTRIAYGKGVCGTSWAERRSIVVPDVEAFPGHIACSSRSRSEIVVPFYNSRGEVCAVLDVDSEALFAFDETDARYLEAFSVFLTPLLDAGL